jgi:hypothetical protein
MRPFRKLKRWGMRGWKLPGRSIWSVYRRYKSIDTGSKERRKWTVATMGCLERSSIRSSKALRILMSMDTFGMSDHLLFE